MGQMMMRLLGFRRIRVITKMRWYGSSVAEILEDHYEWQWRPYRGR